MTFSIYVDSLINPGEEVRRGVRIEICDDRIVSISADRAASREDLQFSSSICSPALINAHDHLKFTWPERIGNPPYSNSYDWRPVLHQARSKFAGLELEDLYWLGTYKNIFSGAATIANHSRRLSHRFFLRYPVRILYDFTREVFVHSDPRAHDVGAGARFEAELAKLKQVPFVVHIAEGIDDQTARELAELESMGGLFDGSVLIHGINLSEKDVIRIEEARASVVWCPTSNRFLFNRTAPIQTLLSHNVNVALGTDSTCSGSEDLLKEMRSAITELTAILSEQEAAQTVFKFVTSNAAKAYKLSDHLGRIAPGASADLLIFETSHENPVLGLCESQPEIINLLTCKGKWVLGTISATSKLPCGYSTQTIVKIGGQERQLAGEPLELLKRVSSRCNREPLFFPLGRILADSL